MNPWAATWVTAVHELRDARRSRRALIVMALFLAFSLGATNLMVTWLHVLEQQLMETLQLTESNRSGVVTSTLWETDQFRRAIEDGVKDKDLAEALVNTPPIAMLYGWLSYFFAPFLVVLIASTRVSGDDGGPHHDDNTQGRCSI